MVFVYNYFKVTPEYLFYGQTVYHQFDNNVIPVLEVLFRSAVLQCQEACRLHEGIFVTRYKKVIVVSKCPLSDPSSPQLRPHLKMVLRGFINMFSRQVELFERNFFLRKTFLQMVKPGRQNCSHNLPLMKPLGTYMARWTSYYHSLTCLFG